MELYRPLRDVEPIGDLLVREVVEERFQDFPLPAADRGRQTRLRRCSGRRPSCSSRSSLRRSASAAATSRSLDARSSATSDRNRSMVSRSAST